MPISYAGCDLLFDNPGDCLSIESFLDRFAPLEDLRLFGSAPVAVADGRWAPRNPSKQAVGLANHNWSDPPRLRLNTLQWPATGASRWARFVGIVDEARLDRIIAALATSDADQSNKHGKLILSEGYSHRKRKVEANMYLLPPRRIAVDGSAGSTKLWLLPLVDERYLWQFIDVANITANNIGAATLTWALLLGATKYGSLVPLSNDGLDLDAISADYFKPDAMAFDVRGANVAAALDSAAESVGLRIVRDFDGTVYGMATGRSATRLQDSLGPSGLTENGYETIAGGKADRWNALRVPATCEVYFPRCCDNGKYHTVAVDASDFTDAITLAANKVIYTRAEAEIVLAGSTVVNTADCDTLAERIARDYYAWLEENYDLTFAGVKEWQPNGYDDWLVYSFAACTPIGEPTFRVMSHAYNFGTQQQFQSFRFAITPVRAQFQGGDVVALGGSLGAATELSVTVSNSWGDTTMFDTASNIEAKVGGLYNVDFFAAILTGLLGTGSYGTFHVNLERYRSGAWAKVGYSATGNAESLATGGGSATNGLRPFNSALVDLLPGEKLRLVGYALGTLAGTSTEWGIKLSRV